MLLFGISPSFLFQKLSEKSTFPPLETFPLVNYPRTEVDEDWLPQNQINTARLPSKVELWFVCRTSTTASSAKSSLDSSNTIIIEHHRSPPNHTDFFIAIHTKSTCNSYKQTWLGNFIMKLTIVIAFPIQFLHGKLHFVLFTYYNFLWYALSWCLLQTLSLFWVLQDPHSSEHVLLKTKSI